jgi:hypothetical protein
MIERRFPKSVAVAGTNQGTVWGTWDAPRTYSNSTYDSAYDPMMGAEPCSMRRYAAIEVLYFMLRCNLSYELHLNPKQRIAG